MLCDYLKFIFLLRLLTVYVTAGYRRQMNYSTDKEIIHTALLIISTLCVNIYEVRWKMHEGRE